MKVGESLREIATRTMDSRVPVELESSVIRAMKWGSECHRTCYK
jgi:hypothetical protein